MRYTVEENIRMQGRDVNTGSSERRESMENGRGRRVRKL